MKYDHDGSRRVRMLTTRRASGLRAACWWYGCGWRSPPARRRSRQTPESAKLVGSFAC